MWYNNPTERGDFMPQIIPIRNLKDTATISEMCHNTNEPIFVTKNGYGDMVIMSMQAYEEKMALLDMKVKINAAESNVAEGKVYDAKKSLRKIRDKYNV